MLAVWIRSDTVTPLSKYENVPGPTMIIIISIYHIHPLSDIIDWRMTFIIDQRILVVYY